MLTKARFVVSTDPGQDVLHILDALGNIIAFVDSTGAVNAPTSAGIILTDTVTGLRYRLTIANGVITQTQVT